jgi:hypothetical protein
MHESFSKLCNMGKLYNEENKLINNHKISRNPSYHEGRTVSKATTRSILDTTRKFVERLAKDEFNLKLKEFGNHEYLELPDHKGSKLAR